MNKGKRMNLREVYKKSEDIASRVVDGEAVLVTASTGMVTILNEVASRFWEELDGKKAMQEIVDILLNEFDVSSSLLESDLAVLVDEFKAKGFLK